MRTFFPVFCASASPSSKVTHLRSLFPPAVQAEKGMVAASNTTASVMKIGRFFMQTCFYFWCDAGVRPEGSEIYADRDRVRLSEVLGKGSVGVIEHEQPVSDPNAAAEAPRLGAELVPHSGCNRPFEHEF